jgi:hypothetical protein
MIAVSQHLFYSRSRWLEAVKMDRLIEIKPEVDQTGSATIIQFTTSTGDGESFKLEFAVEELYQPSPLAVSEAMLLATIALAMQRKRALRVHGKISRSLRHSIDLYQEACSCWWPRRYCKVPIEVDIADDQPAATARGVLCFSGGLDSIYSAHSLGAAKQIDTGLFVAGYDIDAGPGQYQQRDRVARLLDRLSLQMTVVSTNVRQVLGQQVIEGAQGSYLGAALSLLSDRFGRGFVSSGVVDLADLGVSDPVHEATMPLLGSARCPILVYGGQVSRIDKMAKIAAMPKLFCDVRVCLGRTDDGHCRRCPKCLLNAFAHVALTGKWPVWYPEEEFEVRYLSSMPLNETRRRYGLEILRRAAISGQSGTWHTALAALLGAITSGQPGSRDGNGAAIALSFGTHLAGDLRRPLPERAKRNSQ